MKLLLLCCLVYVVLGIQLKFNNGKFRIMQVTDTHISDSDEKDNNTLTNLNKLLDYEKPDFVAITGDLISGYMWDKKPGFYEKKWKQITEPFINHNIPYALVLGNHDTEADLTRKQVMELDVTNPMSVSQVGPDELPGSSNYLVQVQASNSTSNILNLWFFDSQQYNCAGVPGWGCVAPETVDWYYQTSKVLEEKNGKQHGFAFVHIPPPEIMSAWNNDNVYTVLGEKHQVSLCSSMNTGLISRFLMRGDVEALFLGHDHGNFYDSQYNNIRLIYGRKSGFGGDSYPEWLPNGIRMIEIDEESLKWNTYIRFYNMSQAIMSELHWTNGTQYICRDAKGVTEDRIKLQY